jgi:acyl-CoA thioester hydrolase
MMHRFVLRVYFEDTDAGGVVYHASYLRFAERARTEALRDAGAPHAELQQTHGLLFVVRSLEMDYLRPARLDSLLVVETTPLAVGGASVTLRQVFVENGEPIGTLTVRLVCIAQATLRPARIPDRWREVLKVDAGGEGLPERG